MISDKHALEKKVIDEINGIRYSGMEGGYAYVSFRQNYYEKIQDQEEKSDVRIILTDLLKNDHKNPHVRSKAAWICADIGLPGIEEDLTKVLKEPAISATVFVRGIEYALKIFKLEKKMKDLIEGLKFTDKNDIADMAYDFKNIFFDQIKDPLEKADVINLLVKFISSNLYVQTFRVKAAWISAYLGISTIKEEIVKLADDPSWIESPYRTSLDDILRYVSESNK